MSNSEVFAQYRLSIENDKIEHRLVPSGKKVFVRDGKNPAIIRSSSLLNPVTAVVAEYPKGASIPWEVSGLTRFIADGEICLASGVVPWHGEGISGVYFWTERKNSKKIREDK